MYYFKNGNLHNYLAKEFKNLKWKNKIGILLDIINGLKEIHEQNIIHHNLHSGNIFQHGYYSTYVADLRLSISADKSSTSNENNIYGVLPYVVPEVLNGEPYTMASDVYSFGVLMSLVSTGQQTFYNIAHDANLAFKICEGVRPVFSTNTPKFYIELAYKCMSASLNECPTAEEIEKVIRTWTDALFCTINDLKNFWKWIRLNLILQLSLQLYIQMLFILVDY